MAPPPPPPRLLLVQVLTGSPRQGKGDPPYYGGAAQQGPRPGPAGAVACPDVPPGDVRKRARNAARAEPTIPEVLAAAVAGIGGSARPGQDAMARAVGRAIGSGLVGEPSGLPGCTGGCGRAI